MVHSMRSVMEVLQLSKKYVKEGAQGRPDFEVEEWVASCLHCKRFDLYIRHDCPVEEDELSCIKEGLRPLKQGLPLAYLLQSAPFWKDSFFVRREVLIPRPESELVVERACALVRTYGFSTLADICTGTGCIGLSIKREMPSLEVILSDLYEEPIECAKKNSVRLQLPVDIRQGDLLDTISTREVEVVVCNPPYLSLQEYDILDHSVRDFEPRVALLGGNSGVEMYERLVTQAVHRGVKAMIMEIGASQHKQVHEIFMRHKASSISSFRDLSGNWRVVEALLCT